MADFKPIPNLVLFFACEDAMVSVDETIGDLQYGWWEIKKPLCHVFMPSGVTKGFCTPELYLYYQLTGGCGVYQLIAEFWQLDLVEPKKSKKWAWSDLITVRCENELAVVEEVVPLEKVPFPTPGLYQFTMKERGEVLPGGEYYLRVFPGESE